MTKTRRARALGARKMADQAGAAAASSPQTSSSRRTTLHEVTEVDRQAVVRVKRRLRRSAFAYVAAIFVYIVVTALADTGTVFSDMPGAVQREVVPWLYGLRYTALLFMNLLPLGCLYNNFDMYVALRLARRVTIVATILQMMVILVIVCVVLACADCDPSLYDPVFRWHDLTLLFTWFVTVLCTMFADAMLLHSVMFNIVQGVFVIAVTLYQAFKLWLLRYPRYVQYEIWSAEAVGLTLPNGTSALAELLLLTPKSVTANDILRAMTMSIGLCIFGGTFSLARKPGRFAFLTKRVRRRAASGATLTETAGWRAAEMLTPEKRTTATVWPRARKWWSPSQPSSPTRASSPPPEEKPVLVTAESRQALRRAPQNFDLFEQATSYDELEKELTRRRSRGVYPQLAAAHSQAECTPSSRRADGLSRSWWRRCAPTGAAPPRRATSSRRARSSSPTAAALQRGRGRT